MVIGKFSMVNVKVFGSNSLRESLERNEAGEVSAPLSINAEQSKAYSPQVD
jgi:hypothetical protein